MALKPGSKAPDFTLASTSGRNFSFHRDHAGKPAILYFYPKDFTPVCTAEACEFRDTFDFFRDSDMDVFGISRDDVPTHQRFKEAHKLPFELLADVDGKVAAKYKATVPILKFTRRITYLLDKDHTIVAAYENLFASAKHVEEMVKRIRSGAVA